MYIPILCKQSFSLPFRPLCLGDSIEWVSSRVLAGSFFILHSVHFHLIPDFITVSLSTGPVVSPFSPQKSTRVYILLLPIGTTYLGRSKKMSVVLKEADSSNPVQGPWIHRTLFPYPAEGTIQNSMQPL